VTFFEAAARQTIPVFSAAATNDIGFSEAKQGKITLQAR